MNFVCISVVSHIFEKLSIRTTTLFFTSPHFASQEVTILQSDTSPNFEIFGTPNVGVFRKTTFGCSPQLLITKNNIRGKVVVSPKSRPWWVLWVRECLWRFVHQKCFNYALTNLLFGLCKSVWKIDLLIIHPNPHPEALACISYLRNATK
jgi:hypothetical protein